MDWKPVWKKNCKLLDIELPPRVFFEDSIDRVFIVNEKIGKYKTFFFFIWGKDWHQA